MKWTLGAIGLLLIGMVFQLGLLVYAMYVLLGVMLVSRTLSRTWINSLDATRECNRVSAEIDDTAAVAVVIRNLGALPIPWLILEDSLPKDTLSQRPPRLKVTGPRVKVSQLGPKGEKTLLYQVQFLQRGYYQIGPLLLESGDVFGLHRRFKVATQPHFVLVFPKVVPLPSYDITSRRPIGEMRLLHRLFEDPTRIAGVRQYQHGDPMSRVHWRATARTGELHCKTYDASCIAGATLLVDFHLDSHPATDRNYTSELAVTTAASLAHAVYQLGQQVGLITNGRDAAERVREEGHREEFLTRQMAKATLETPVQNTRLRPVTVKTRRGAEQITRILETLARLELTDGLTFAQLVDESREHLTRDATVIAILREVTEEAALALGVLRRGGYAVEAVVVTHYNERPPDWAHPPAWGSRLLAQGVEFRVVESEESLIDVCSRQLMTR